MKQKKYSLFNLVMQRIAASPPGAWFFARTLHHLDKIFLRLSNGRKTMSSLVSGLPVVVVTTKGARSGLPRTIPLLCIRDECNPATFALIATNWGQQHYPGWYFNLKANPNVRCSIAGKTGEYLAQEAEDEEYDRFWQFAVDAYVGFPLYKQRIRGRRIPIMIMTPVEP
jgi:deazaflavin-dependent oxidoreductase (nitroreductase family)